MAGSSEIPNPKEEPKPRAKVFSCPSCGSSITVRYPGQAFSAVCDACHSVIDCQSENYKIIAAHFAREKMAEQLIPFGQRGKLFGKEWEVIGFLARETSSYYFWEEYLLFNPYYGYRWLTSNAGHWNFVTPLKIDLGTERYSWIEYSNSNYRLYYGGDVTTRYVLGEFYWRIQVGKSIYMRDYISPPYMLSSENDNREVSWSLGEYIEPEIVEQAFKLKKKLKRPFDIAPNQPSKAAKSWQEIRLMWLVFFLFLTFVQILHSTTCFNRTAFRQGYAFKTNTPSTDSITTPVFTLDKNLANVEITVDANVNNSWFYTNIDLVNDKTGETISCEKTVEYYRGVDGGESWSEGGQSGKIMLSSVPGGSYYLNIDYDSGSYPTLNQSNFSVTVTRDVPSLGNYFGCLLLLSIIPLLAFWLSRAYEVKRWSQSDFSPYGSSDYS